MTNEQSKIEVKSPANELRFAIFFIGHLPNLFLRALSAVRFFVAA
jgi:hypothetical protein